MSIFSLRKPLRLYASHLNRAQRKRWMQMRLERSPRVPISTGYVVPSIARTYTHMNVRGIA